MGAVEDAVDSAAAFIAPFLAKGSRQDAPVEPDNIEAEQLVAQALSHLQAINVAEQGADPNAPYDASLFGIVYGLLDLITTLGILPCLSPGVTFGQRPKSVLIASLTVPRNRNENLLSSVLKRLTSILEQNGNGVQPLLTQRLLPDILSAAAELSLSPTTSAEGNEAFESTFRTLLSSTPVSRLLPILTSFLQQDIPPWLKQQLSTELALIPLRLHGIRHTIEFLSLSYISKHGKVPEDASGPRTQLPIHLEAVTQASRLLTSVPSVMNQSDWYTQLAPQLWSLLDGNDGKELSRAAGQIIAGGILNRKATGAPGSIGWELFARPLLQAIDPQGGAGTTTRESTSDKVIVKEQDLKLALKRLSVIASSYTHVGLMKRFIGPVLLPLWGLLGYARSRPLLNKEWTQFPRMIMLRYMSTASDPKQLDRIATNLFWDGGISRIFGPGSQGGIEIRQRKRGESAMSSVDGLLSRIGNLDAQVNLLISLLGDADISDDIAGALFTNTTKRWLSTSQPGPTLKPSLTSEQDIDPFSALADAKLSSALATKFQDKFARSPQHVIELMAQLLQSFVAEHKTRSRRAAGTQKSSRANLGRLVSPLPRPAVSEMDAEGEELVSFVLSIIDTVTTSPDFKQSDTTASLLSSILPSLQYLSQPQTNHALPPLIINAAANLLQARNVSLTPTTIQDPLAEKRAALKSTLIEVTDSEAPNRTWALSNLRKLIKNPTTFSLIDAPSTAHLILSASVADPESYVHTAAMPILVDLATRAPNPTVRIIVDAFMDIDESSLRSRKEKDIVQALDFRLRVGEILNNLILSDDIWQDNKHVEVRYNILKMITEATLSLASRRGQRKDTLTERNALAEAERQVQEESEAAWGGPIPNLLDPDAEDPVQQQERDALLKIVQGWEDTGIGEDVRIRASALSIFGSVLEKRLPLLSQATVDAGLQMVLLVLTMEIGEAEGVLRRAAVLVIMGLLRGMDALLEEGKESSAGLGINQANEVEKVVQWVRDEDMDGLTRDHAGIVLEGLETWRMKKLYKVRDESFRLGPDLGLEGNLRGLDVQPLPEQAQRKGRPLIVEEIE
ncbi:hypothetical protein BDV95DRAFT_611511 [Massariosphaeria phaeospora]|uniref:RNA polymerase II assembly factor Rtp1 C-terminal domain-containing protein n=1 Tax=Massariosphaeria phaeospora TaxID=100035 RepID=A0A7C8M8V1_9PLEO|nr:hypothetical protein BDV95DRAFT_611511 [Massariosphaeria phaeospora]